MGKDGAGAAARRSCARPPAADNIEVSWEEPSGRLRALLDAAKALHARNDADGLLGKVLEVAREAEETQARLVESAKMSALGQLAAGVSHEIRNPLNIIGGSIYFLRDHIDDAPRAKVRDYLEHMEAEVRRASDLLGKLIDFARPEPRSSAPTDVNAVVKRALPLIATVAAARTIEVSPSLRADLPPVDGSASELQQVVVNLLLNACQAFDGAGGGRIDVRTFVEPPGAGLGGGAGVRIEVEDTGRGIDPEDLKRIFEPFFTRREGGTGLGLYTSYGIVERHEGRIELESEPGRGTRISVRLPASRAGIPRAAASDAPGPAPAAPARPPAPPALAPGAPAAIMDSAW